MTDTLTREDVELHTGQKPAEVAHIVDQREHDVTTAYVLGTEVKALCGYIWVPSKDPEKLPLCQACDNIWREQHGGKGFGEL